MKPQLIQAAIQILERPETPLHGATEGRAAAAVVDGLRLLATPEMQARLYPAKQAEAEPEETPEEKREKALAERAKMKNLTPPKKANGAAVDASP